MYICICHAVKEGDYARYNLIGTNCGKCMSDKKRIDLGPPIVREPRFPVEGEYTLDAFGELVVFKNGAWEEAGHERR